MQRALLKQLRDRKLPTRYDICSGQDLSFESDLISARCGDGPPLHRQRERAVLPMVL